MAATPPDLQLGNDRKRSLRPRSAAAGHAMNSGKGAKRAGESDEEDRDRDMHVKNYKQSSPVTPQVEEIAAQIHSLPKFTQGWTSTRKKAVVEKHRNSRSQSAMRRKSHSGNPNAESTVLPMIDADASREFLEGDSEYLHIFQWPENTEDGAATTLHVAPLQTAQCQLNQIAREVPTDIVPVSVVMHETMSAARRDSMGVIDEDRGEKSTPKLAEEFAADSMHAPEPKHALNTAVMTATTLDLARTDSLVVIDDAQGQKSLQMLIEEIPKEDHMHVLPSVSIHPSNPSVLTSDVLDLARRDSLVVIDADRGKKSRQKLIAEFDAESDDLLSDADEQAAADEQATPPTLTSAGAAVPSDEHTLLRSVSLSHLDKLEPMITQRQSRAALLEFNALFDDSNVRTAVMERDAPNADLNGANYGTDVREQGKKQGAFNMAVRICASNDLGLERQSVGVISAAIKERYYGKDAMISAHIPEEVTATVEVGNSHVPIIMERNKEMGVLNGSCMDAATLDRAEAQPTHLFSQPNSQPNSPLSHGPLIPQAHLHLTPPPAHRAPSMPAIH